MSLSLIADTTQSHTADQLTCDRVPLYLVCDPTGHSKSFYFVRFRAISAHDNAAGKPKKYMLM